jgi:TolB-like protein
VLGLVAGLGRFVPSRGGADAGGQSIAVLPLENLSGDKEQEYFADGMTDALISDLARIPALRVISRTSIMSFKGAHRPLPQIAHSLGVQTIAEGSVLRSGNHVRIAVRLVDARNDRPVWSGSYEGELSEVLALQSQVVAAIAGEIDVTLTASNRSRVSRDRRINLGAYDAYFERSAPVLQRIHPGIHREGQCLFSSCSRVGSRLRSGLRRTGRLLLGTL